MKKTKKRKWRAQGPETRSLRSLMCPVLQGRVDHEIVFERKAYLSYTIQLSDVEPARYQHVIHKYLKKMVVDILYNEKRIPKDLVNYIFTFLPILCLPSCSS